jgi:hypothetical protein
MRNEQLEQQILQEMQQKHDGATLRVALQSADQFCTSSLLAKSQVFCLAV